MPSKSREVLEKTSQGQKGGSVPLVLGNGVCKYPGGKTSSWTLEKTGSWGERNQMKEGHRGQH